MRPNDILNALDSITNQTLYPTQILVVDGSTDTNTQESLKTSNYKNLEYFLVDNTYRGAAKQRNYGVDRVNEDVEIVLFLDDDVVLLPNYCEEIIKTFQKNPKALGVGGYIIDNEKWKVVSDNYKPKFTDYIFDNFVVKHSSRNIIRKILGLLSDKPPGFMPEFSHGLGLLPPTGKTYPTEQLIGCTCSFKRSILIEQKFDSFFEGYSLYEDAALSIKISKKGPLYINTNAKLYHYHASGGRPNLYKYGQMVVKNGWYVWRLAHPSPSLKNKMKWHATTLLLIFLRFLNVFTTTKRKEAFTESFGRIFAWVNLFFKKPNIER